MAFTAITDRSVVVQEGVMMDFIASGTIKAGQGVEAVNGMKVKVPTAWTEGFVGVAAYNADDGDQVLVYGPGSIVWTRASGTSVAAGKELGLYADGEFAPSSNGKALALDTQGSADGLFRILIR